MPARKFLPWLRLVFALLLAAQAFAVAADMFRPAYLELREAGDGRYEVLWKVPAQGENMRLAASVRFPEGSVVLGEPTQRLQWRREYPALADQVRERAGRSKHSHRRHCRRHDRRHRPPRAAGRHKPDGAPGSGAPVLHRREERRDGRSGVVLPVAGDRAHSRWRGSSAFRAFVAPHRPRQHAHSFHDHRLYRRPQLDPGCGNAGHGARPWASGRGDHRAQHRLRRRRGRTWPERTTRPDGPGALAGRLQYSACCTGLVLPVRWPKSVCRKMPFRSPC